MVYLLMAVMVGATLVAVYLIGVRHRQLVTKNKENPGYRDAAKVAEVKKVPLKRLLRDMPRSVRVAVAVAVLAFAATLFVSSDSAVRWAADTAEGAVEALAPNEVLVPQDRHAIAVDDFGIIDRVLPPGMHSFYDNPEIRWIECTNTTFDAPRLFTGSLLTYDGRTFVEFRLTTRFGYACNEESVRDLYSWYLYERVRRDVYGDDEAWEYYLEPLVRRVTRALIRGRTAAQLYTDRGELQEQFVALFQRERDIHVVLDIVEFEVEFPEGFIESLPSTDHRLGSYEFTVPPEWNALRMYDHRQSLMRIENSDLNTSILINIEELPEGQTSERVIVRDQWSEQNNAESARIGYEIGAVTSAEAGEGRVWMYSRFHRIVSQDGSSMPVRRTYAQMDLEDDVAVRFYVFMLGYWDETVPRTITRIAESFRRVE